MRVLFIFQTFEKPRRYAWNNKCYDEKENQYGDSQACPKLFCAVTRFHSGNGGQDDEHRGVREDGATYGYGDCLVPRDPQPADNGICDQRMRGEHAGGEQAGVEAVAEQVIAYGKSKKDWKQEGEEAEARAFCSDAF